MPVSVAILSLGVMSRLLFELLAEKLMWAGFKHILGLCTMVSTMVLAMIRQGDLFSFLTLLTGGFLIADVVSIDGE